ncbi:UNVERIFIED_CONTAM: hypothetical protein K2H54_057576 [Gekko kuhli]
MIPKGAKYTIFDGVESQKMEHLSKKNSSSLSPDSSSNESEDEVEYQPHHQMIQEVIKEELEENEDIKEEEEQKTQAVEIKERIVITGDADLDHDQALTQAIKEVKEQHPDMSVTRVVVHKEMEVAEEGD